MKTQNEMITRVAVGVELPATKVKEVIAAYNAELMDSLITDGKARIQGIGTLEVRYRGPRNVRNLKTGEQMVSKESLAIGLKTSLTAKSTLAENVDISNYRKEN